MWVSWATENSRYCSNQRLEKLSHNVQANHTIFTRSVTLLKFSLCSCVPFFFFFPWNTKLLSTYPSIDFWLLIRASLILPSFVLQYFSAYSIIKYTLAAIYTLFQNALCPHIIPSLLLIFSLPLLFPFLLPSFECVLLQKYLADKMPF